MRRGSLLVAAIGLFVCGGSVPVPLAQDTQAGSVRLPPPRREGGTGVAGALASRRSLREYRNAPLALAELSQLLWAAQGRTSDDGGRTAPSAGALYPLEISVVAGAVSGLAPGAYRYQTADHSLVSLAAGDRRRALATAALAQDWLASAPAVLVLAGVYERTARKYGARAERYVVFEAGCAAENVALQAEALGLGTTVVGAFDDAEVARVAGLRSDERPLALLPVGRR